MSNQISLFRDFSYDVTVVMVSYHTGAALWRAIDSVLAQEGLNELILVDNGNSANTRQRLVKKNMKHPRLKVLSGHGNIGLYRGYNLGADRAKGRYILFLSPESVLPHDFLLRMIDGHQKDPQCQLVSCPVTDAEGKLKAESIRPILTPARYLWSHFSYSKLLPAKMKEHLKTAVPHIPDNFAPNAMCFMMESEHFKALNGMSEGYFYDKGDMDLAIKIKDAGGKTVYLPNLTIVDFRTTSRSSSLKASWYALKDTSRYFNRHFKQEYLPGIITSLNAFSSLIWLSKAICRSLAAPFRTTKPTQQKESERCARFLKSYEKFALDETSIPKGTLYDLSQRTPIMLAGVETDIGLCLLRRLLAANLEVVALYDQQVIDFEHEKLTWLHSKLIEQQSPSTEHRPRMLIYADDIRKLPDLMENFKKLGTERILAIGSAYIFRLLSSGNKQLKAEAKSYVLAEGDIMRTSPVLNIDTTLLRVGMTYGMGKDDNISAIARFIKRFGFLPLVPTAHGKRQPIHCDDVAINAISLINQKETYGKSYNLTGEVMLSYKEMVERIFIALGKRKRIFFWKSLPVISGILSPISSLKNFNKTAVKRANEDIVFLKDQLPDALKIPQRNFLQDGRNDISPNI